MNPKTRKPFIFLKGVRQNNLRGFDLKLPLYQVICVTGVSGAGKSTLVFDVLYAEGQRRYVETFSAYLRQYLERLPRPQVEKIDHIPPAIAVEQSNPVKSSRSTVGTLTEITHFTKMLYFRAAKPFCPWCQREISALDPTTGAQLLLEKYSGQAAVITAPVKAAEDPHLLKEGLLSAGYFRLYLADKVADLDEIQEIPEEIEVVLDRLKLEPQRLPLLVEAIEQGFRMAGEVRIHLPYAQEERLVSETRCPYCGFTPPKKTPNLFSFNSPLGACPECRGFGRVIDIDWDLVIPDPKKSLADGAISILSLPSFWEDEEELFSYCREQGIPLDQPWEKLPEETRQRILFGDQKWYGVKGLFDWLETKRYKAHVRILLSRYRAYLPCPACKGSRFKPESLYFRLSGLDIASFYALNISQAREFMKKFLAQKLDRATELLAREVYRRLSYLEEVGLSYLTLDRQSRTLSGGEVARVMLTRALSSELVDTLYLLDEPSTGLHPRDTAQVISFMRRLAERGNTVIVVEHDPEIILASDSVIDLGPGAGEHGGELLYLGPPAKLLEKNTPTAEELRAVRQKKKLDPLIEPSGNFLEVLGAAENNLKGINVRFPLGGLSVLTGVSGSGKSTLLELILYRGLKRLRGEAVEPPGLFRSFRGAEKIQQVILLDQSPLARSPRANPATYLKVYEALRKLLAFTPEAKEAGLSPSAFSFNSAVGQCPSCQGRGVEVVEMQFLSDLYFPCPVCKGKRFKEEILAISWQGKNISDFLNLTFSEAKDFFAPEKASSEKEEKLLEEISRRLDAALTVGLGYLRLGQPLATLSGGEAQRLKIAHHLFLEKGKNNLFLLDEPTIGLHLADIKIFLQALKALLERGNTVILVEHHLEIIRHASWVVDLGPEGGEKGGAVVFQGPPSELLQIETSHTGLWLRRYLNGELALVPQEHQN